jgi:U3 small nucleolar ribonucleoprotein protein IMP4
MSSGLLRRNARLRKEYLYRKSLEGKEAEQYEKKRKIRKALEEGKPIPTEVRAEEASLRREIALEDDNTAVPRTHIDDEYANAGVIPPKVLITTSRDPSSRLAQFAKELKLVFPNSQRLNRGGLVVKDLVESARAHEFTDIVVVHEHRCVAAVADGELCATPRAARVLASMRPMTCPFIRNS